MLVKRRIQNSISAVAASVMITVGVAFLYSSQASAQSTANTLKVSPVRTDIEINPGESKTVETTVTNLTGDAITVRPVANDFVAGDDRGTPALILDEDKFAPSHSLKRFMGPLATVTIPANQTATIPVVITVPADAQAGGYFGAVRFAPTDPDGGGQVNLSASVASLILLTVPGEMVEKIDMLSFDIQQDGSTGNSFSSPTGIQATVKFQNKGNVQIGPFGKVTVMQGDTVVYEANFNSENPRDMILPDSSRRWDIPFQKIGAIGQYTVVATFTYGATNQTIEVTKSFWVIPTGVIIAAIIVAVLILGLIAGIIIYIVRRNKRRNRGTGLHVRGRR